MWWLWVGCGGEPGEKAPPPRCGEEIPYDGVDQDCDGVDLVDVDGDGFDALAADGTDCDDGDASVHPRAQEAPYDDVDQDCDGADLVDVDGDGVDAIEAGGGDCDDGDETIAPGQPDDAGDGVDRDCDGVDGVDADGDGFADWRSGGPDCDDADPARNPDAEEIWYDGVDQDCDRACDQDADGDGAVLPGSVVTNGSPCDGQAGPGVFAPEDCDDTDPGLVWISVVDQQPRPGQTSAPVDAPLEVRLSVPDPTAVLTLTDDGGTPIPGASAVAGDVVTFVPAGPLAPSQRHLATVSWRCDTTTWEFRTEAAPLDPADLAGAAWELDLAQANWTEPPLVGPLFAPLLSPVTLTVAGVGADTLDLRFGGRSPQDTCQPTVELAGASFVDNPRVAAQVPSLSFDLYGLLVEVAEVDVSAVLAPAALTEGTLSMELDTRSVVEVFAPGGGPDAVCQLVAVFGIACDPCTNGSGTYCLWLAADGVEGSPVSPFDLVTTADVAADPTCP